MGITGPSAEEQAWLDQQLVDLEEETAEGEAPAASRSTSVSS